ncbi:MAG: hypothetical protein HUJ86_00510, partial [Synergistes sp.]|nr:hypothetical protein [Synergistes sp.]
MAPKHFFNIISQSAAGGNRRRTRVCAGAAIFVFIAAALCCFASNRLAENKWRRGWASWKEGRTDAALEHWSSGGITAPFERERSRISYWKIRAFEKSGKEKEASVAASLLALRDPLGFYTLVLAHSG